MEQNKKLENTSPDLHFTEPDVEKYIALAQMNQKRKHASRPNTEQAWNAFKKHIIPQRPKNNIWSLVLASVTGAAAMLAIIFLYNYIADKQDEQDMVIAMTYDNLPQQIVLSGNEGTTDLSHLDSLSFRLDGPKLKEHEKLAAPNTDTENDKSATHLLQKLSTPRGMDFKVILSDGTEVWLNAESTIEFPSAFSGKERRVKLKGEAYFKVARNEKVPFIVTSDKLNIRVLGTEFNFKNYEIPHVSLIHGSVEVFRPGQENSEIQLIPGQDAWCDNKTDSIRVCNIDTYSVTQWTTGLFYFDSMSLIEIMRELGRWYNLGVIFRNSEHINTKLHFSASRTEDIHQAIDNLNKLQIVNITLEGKNIVVN